MASTSGRGASSSDEEPTTSVNRTPSESKKARRRRGRRTRKKSENSPVSASEAASPHAVAESRKRTCSLGAPPAPRNTNDFLLEDMERREEDAAKRLRREQLDSAVAARMDEDDRQEHEESLPGEAEFEDQYEESWQECVIDKYKELSHEELARRMAVMEKSHDETERKLRWERSKSDYLQSRLLQAEEQIRIAEENGTPSADSPPPPIPIPPPHHAHSSPYHGGLNGLHHGGGCSPNVISSPRA